MRCSAKRSGVVRGRAPLPCFLGSFFVTRQRMNTLKAAAVWRPNRPTNQNLKPLRRVVVGADPYRVCGSPFRHIKLTDKSKFEALATGSPGGLPLRACASPNRPTNQNLNHSHGLNFATALLGQGGTAAIFAKQICTSHPTRLRVVRGEPQFSLDVVFCNEAKLKHESLPFLRFLKGF